jgi:hypothetical protein
MFGVTWRRILQPFGADRTGRCPRSRLQSVVNSFIEEVKKTGQFRRTIGGGLQLIEEGSPGGLAEDEHDEDKITTSTRAGDHVSGSDVNSRSDAVTQGRVGQVGLVGLTCLTRLT